MNENDQLIDIIREWLLKYAPEKRGCHLAEVFDLARGRIDSVMYGAQMLHRAVDNNAKDLKL